MTRFYLPINPELYVITVVNVAAFYITNRTTGSYVRHGQTYGIIETDAVDFQPPNAPGQPVPFIPYFSTFGKNIPIQVDCAKMGIEAMAITIHEAGWKVIGDLGIIGGTYSTMDTDRNACPHVAPTAHFRAVSDGSTGVPAAMGNDVTPLELPRTVSVTLDAYLTEHDAPITNYEWFINGSLYGSGYSITINPPVGSTGVRLRVTDALGKSSFADGAVFVTEPPPMCKEERDPDACPPPSPNQYYSAHRTTIEPMPIVTITSVKHCLVKDWYQSTNGGPWVYTNTEVVSCWYDEK